MRIVAQLKKESQIQHLEELMEKEFDKDYQIEKKEP